MGPRCAYTPRGAPFNFALPVTGTVSQASVRQGSVCHTRAQGPLRKLVSVCGPLGFDRHQVQVRHTACTIAGIVQPSMGAIADQQLIAGGGVLPHPPVRVSRLSTYPEGLHSEGVGGLFGGALCCIGASSHLSSLPLRLQRSVPDGRMPDRETRGRPRLGRRALLY
jgi:hypothetical protein